MLIILLALVLPVSAAPERPEAIAKQILAPLLDPAKIATLKGDRPVNARFYRVFYWIETARRAGGSVPEVIDLAQAEAGYGSTNRARADKEAIRWNCSNLNSWGCFSSEGMAKMRKGGSPRITRGEHSGESIALDHVLPRAVVPELAARFFNLEAIPAKVNLAKSAKIRARELAVARLWQKEGLLSVDGLRAVESRMGP